MSLSSSSSSNKKQTSKGKQTNKSVSQSLPPASTTTFTGGPIVKEVIAAAAIEGDHRPMEEEQEVKIRDKLVAEMLEEGAANVITATAVVDPDGESSGEEEVVEEG